MPRPTTEALKQIMPAASTTSAAPRIADREATLTVVDGLAGQIAEGTVQRDHVGTFPAQELKAIADSGLLGIAVPERLGGPGLPPSVIARTLCILAKADPSVAQLLIGHFGLQRIVLGDPPAGAQELCDAALAEILDGARLGGAIAERNTAHAMARRTTFSPTGGGGYRIDGRKYYSTGARGAEWLAVFGQPTQEKAAVAIALLRIGPGDPPAGLAFEDDWDAFGQRGTASGTVVLDGVDVPPGHLIQPPVPVGGPPPTISGAYDQLLHLAIDVGIAEAALEDGANHVRELSRPWFEAEQPRAAEEPVLIMRFGELAVRLHSLESMFDRACDAVDAAAAAPRLTDANTAAASLAVAEGKALAQTVAVSIASDVIELAGANGTDESRALDRHWRNARTHTVHDPARWKLYHIGNHLLNGVAPPRNPRI